MKTLSLLVMLVISVTSALGQTNYLLVPLGQNFSPTGVSENGFVCGNLNNRAFIHDGVSLIQIPLPGSTSMAADINADGVVTGSYLDGFANPYRYYPLTNVVEPMSVFLSSWLLGEGYAIDDSRTVVGPYVQLNPVAKQRGHMWTTDPEAFLITPNRFGVATPRGINNFSPADVVGDADQQATWFRGFQGAQSVQLGFLPGGNQSIALGVNDNRIVVGASRVTGGAEHAFSYLLPSGPMVDLGAIGVGSSRAFDINESDTIVGFGTSDLGDRALRWDSTGMRDLNSLILTGTKGWTVRRAKAINNQGWIAAEALYLTQPYGVLLIPAE